ncbi:DHHA2 domain-containing protein [Cladophialophora immunda]|nr:DHHA2 domain-containing protein [Cladophialophora immunda]
MRSMTSYFSRMRSLALNSSVSSKSSHSANGTSSKPVLVMGNPSADLDSFVSAVVTSFCYNLAGNDAAYARRPIYIPLLNLPSVRASDLWRLRPEFGVALRLALGESPDTVGKEGREQGKTDALKELVTIADIKADEGSELHKLFTDSKNSESQPSDATEKQSLFLVDHNSPSIPGLSDEAISARFTVSGCIDHHVDENYVAQDADPRIVTTGIGSCTSLVVTHLRERGMWPSCPSEQLDERGPNTPHIDPEVLQQISRLALAPILIDTWKLRAKGDKCSDTDREVVRFLESVIATTSTGHRDAASPPRSSQPARQSAPAGMAEWDRDAFFSCIATAKANSLDLLTMQEVFDRDYKAWTERTSGSSSGGGGGGGSGKEINIGISSLVKPLSWLVAHAGTGAVDAFLAEIEAFATDPARGLGVFCMLTRTGDGRKEVAVLVLDEAVEGAIDAFEARGRDELRLSDWSASAAAAAAGDGGPGGSSDGEGEVKGLTEGLTRKFGDKGRWKIWWMGDTSKSRKQVGPLLRDAVRNL